MALTACLVVKGSCDSGCHRKTLEKQALVAGRPTRQLDIYG